MRPTAKIQRLTDQQWETLVECLDNPIFIEMEVHRLLAKGYKIAELWVNGPTSGRKAITQFFDNRTNLTH